MGNFSFGDYFKELAIPWSWELVTEGWGFDGDRLWITVHESDDEAEAIWHEQVGVPLERIQRLGDKDNFWQMGDTGPCGPCSEIHIDRGPAFGPDGGPLGDPEGDRFMEFWNLVFMQYNQAPDGTRTRVAEAVDRHRRRARADPGSAAGRRLGVGDRPHAAADRHRVLADGQVLPGRRLRRPRQLRDARARRARPVVDDARERRCVPVERGAWLRAASDPAPRRALRVPARHRAAGDAAPVRDGDRRDGQRLPGRHQEPRLHPGRVDEGGRAVPAHAADRADDPRRRARRRHEDVVRPDRIPAARHLRLPARAHPGDRRRARHRGRRRPGSNRDGGAAGARQGGAQGRRRRRADRPVPRGRRAVRCHRVPRLQHRHHREPRARGRRRARRK